MNLFSEYKLHFFFWNVLRKGYLLSTRSRSCAIVLSIHSACFAYQLAHISYTGVNIEFYIVLNAYIHILVDILI